MKNFVIIIFTCLVTADLSAQNDITGYWNGLLEVQGISLRLDFHIMKTDDGLVSKMDSPDQGASDIPVTTTNFEYPRIKLIVANAQIEYVGELSGDTIVGNFKQNGHEFPLNLTRANAQSRSISLKPQEPIPPFTYYTENITFKNTSENITLTGTLSLPAREGKCPVVILISGSGPQTRDGEIMGHKPFLVISDHLTKSGIGVLRYDERGVGQSEGNFNSATSKDLSSDVSSAVNYLKTRKDIDPEKIGLIGHSEGGLIAPMVAAKSDDIAFIVLLAAPGIRGDQLLLKQQEMIAKVSGVNEQEIERSRKVNTELFETVVSHNGDIEILRSDLEEYMKRILQNDPKLKPATISANEYLNIQVNQITTPWMLHFLKYNPRSTLQSVKCPVFAMNGEKDLQVSSKENLKAIKKALKRGRNRNVTTEEFDDLNHLFQECKTGLPGEYGTIDQTFSPIVLNRMSSWIIATGN